MNTAPYERRSEMVVKNSYRATQKMILWKPDRKYDEIQKDNPTGRPEATRRGSTVYYLRLVEVSNCSFIHTVEITSGHAYIAPVGLFGRHYDGSAPRFDVAAVRFPIAR